ncbi:MBOAT family O-acyltransferase [Pseudodesulfovibrio piezophilus]|uniref:Alginate o-acetyltransferase algI n=1 Tax=Pseudodesulfovibrio piezophilus (strain DSM 21447 / JCM 15486 / C1TLV30) TaxID=1322246 RepID=M1WTV4_PSEP2|nr:MBOAT family protein [Pseudodesulfovibrio piezophilus]CCH49927.1 Alginate o-acetyltransferase algI [Pseudodesulfovibrio piezophilus C1TLV30]
MIFSSITFCLFFLCILVGLGVFRRNSSRKRFLLLGSWFFYAYWDWRFLFLILISTIVDFVIGAMLGHEKKKGTRRLLLGVSLTVNLGLLGFFKYFNFFIDSMRPLVESFGFHVGSLDIILPVGISFYTFQTLSYTIDIYRGQIKPHDNLLDFSLFVSFFPQLVAGPIVRASHFLPQLKEYKPLTAGNAYAGFQLFTYGLCKKVFLADRLALFSDHVFTNAGLYDCATTWMAAGAYSLQIYLDFSGYSDMAIGIARILGYDLGKNFNFPYLSRSPQEFWRRWHISLSTWVRDYLYIPLGGSRRGKARTYVNVFVSMGLCGLWHGAAWTFVVWGMLHGVGLVLNRMWQWKAEGPGFRLIGRGVAWIGTMLFVVVGWVLFRSVGFSEARLMLRQMFVPESGVNWFFPYFPFVLGVVAGAHILKGFGFYEKYLESETVRWYSPALLFSLLWLVIIFQPTGFNPFIYFQF